VQILQVRRPHTCRISLAQFTLPDMGQDRQTDGQTDRQQYIDYCPHLRHRVGHNKVIQESSVIAKMTARCAAKSKQPHLYLRSGDSVLTQFNRTLWA